jgi:hypothetical protein
MKGKSTGKLKDTFIWRRKSILLEGSQASPDRPSDKDTMKMKTLNGLEIRAAEF